MGQVQMKQNHFQQKKEFRAGMAAKLGPLQPDGAVLFASSSR